MAKPRPMPFWAADWMSSVRVRALTHAQRGMYIDLLALSWEDPDGVIPEDFARLIPGVRRRDTEALAVFFPKIKDGLCRQNPRVRLHLKSDAAFRQSQAEKGRLSGISRNRGSSPVEPNANRTRTEREPPTPSPTTTTTTSPSEKLSHAKACSSESGDVRRVFSRWSELHWSGNGRKPVLDAKRRSRIKARLKEHSADTLCLALKGALRDDWTMGRDPQSPRPYRELQTILKSAEKVERLAALAEGETGGETDEQRKQREHERWLMDIKMGR
jgi:hypothetical protein